jgi:CheY-like chemotaxis protein
MQPPAQTDPAPTALPRRLRVLVADGNPDAADSLAFLLGLWGHDARAAYAGPAALELAQTHRPAVVLADLVLPGLDGLRLAERLRGRAALVALTGLGRPDDRRRAAEAGFGHFLLKPADPEAVRALLRGLAGGRGPSAPEAERQLRADRAQPAPAAGAGLPHAPHGAPAAGRVAARG